MALATGDEAPQSGVVFGGGVVAGEEPVFAADRHPLEGAFRSVVVDVEEVLRRIPRKRLPLVLGIGNGRRHGAPRQDDLALGVEPRLDPL